MAEGGLTDEAYRCTVADLPDHDVGVERGCDGAHKFLAQSTERLKPISRSRAREAASSAFSIWLALAVASIRRPLASVSRGCVRQGWC
jgi:hypothetical protein